MDRKLSNLLPMVIGGIFLVTWIVIINLLCDISSLGSLGWFGFSFVLISFVIAFFAGSYARKKQPNNDSALIGIPLFLTILFILFSVTVNTIFLIFRLIPLLKILIIIDVLCIAVYLILLFSSSLHLLLVKHRGMLVSKQTSFITQFSTDLGQLIANTSEPELKTSLHKLKETVDYSTNTSMNISEHYEQMMGLQLEKLRHAVREKAETSAIEKLVSESIILWQGRNASIT